MFENPVTELKRHQNPKRPLPFFPPPEWLQYFLNRSKIIDFPFIFGFKMPFGNRVVA
jgi:hypothetical protein